MKAKRHTSKSIAIRVDEDVHALICRLAGMKQAEISRPVSLNEILRQALGLDPTEREGREESSS